MRRHVIWGWLQVGSVVEVDQCRPNELDWARYHPHFNRPPSRNNVLYLAADRLTLPGAAPDRLGAGHLPLLLPRLQLTAPDAVRPGDWQVPRWMTPGPDSRTPLTYHGDPARWSVHDDAVRLSTVGRGQEFILDTDDYPEAVDWASATIGPDLRSGP